MTATSIGIDLKVASAIDKVTAAQMKSLKSAATNSIQLELRGHTARAGFEAVIIAAVPNSRRGVTPHHPRCGPNNIRGDGVYTAEYGPRDFRRKPDAPRHPGAVIIGRDDRGCDEPASETIGRHSVAAMPRALKSGAMALLDVRPALMQRSMGGAVPRLGACRRQGARHQPEG